VGGHRRWWALSQDHLLRRSLGKGKVFVIGCGQYGQLGLGQRIDQLDKPALIQALDQVPSDPPSTHLHCTHHTTHTTHDTTHTFLAHSR